MGAVKLLGPCKGRIEVQVQGYLQAPGSPTGDSWVSFEHVDLLTLSGSGTFDGQGKAAWGKNDCVKSKYCNKLPIVSLFQSHFYNYKYYL